MFVIQRENKYLACIPAYYDDILCDYIDTHYYWITEPVFAEIYQTEWCAKQMATKHGGRVMRLKVEAVPL